MPTLETKAPPPVVAVLSACVMWWIAQMPFSSADLQRSDAMTRLVIVIMLFFAAVGIGFLTPAILAFRRANTTTSPMKPSAASTLVDTGVFRISRHPMYLGVTCLLIAWAAYLTCMWALIGPAVFSLYIDRFQILPEERALRIKFGEAYESYARRVRRWL